MTTREMVQENNRLREQMTPANRDFYEDIVVYVRDSRADRQRGEQRLLELAREVLEAQQKGISASTLFGGDAEAFAQSVVDTLPQVRKLEGSAYYLMIAWTGLTILFLAEAVIGFGAQLAGHGGDQLNRISLLAVILVAAGSVALTEIIMNSLGKTADAGPQKPGINLKAIGVYLVIMVVVMVAGFSLRGVLPVWTVPPWVSLILCVIGFLGLRFVFLRKTK